MINLGNGKYKQIRFWTKNTGYNTATHAIFFDLSAKECNRN